MSVRRDKKPQVRRANCEARDAWEEDDPLAAVYLETVREIREGDELLFNYGDDYWDEQEIPLFKRFVIDYL